jgi:ubiquinone/menaquinone biosynthesis C-methylase UbiE
MEKNNINHFKRMNSFQECRSHNNNCTDKVGVKRHHGPSSTHLHTPQEVFNKIQVKEGTTILDLGCGIGDYSIYASRLVGTHGKVLAVDSNMSIINRLQNNIHTIKASNIEGHVCDITTPLPFEDNSIDICLIITVLHALDLDCCEHILFSELHRVMNPKGKLITVDCKKENQRFGPPIQKRIAARDLRERIEQYGFAQSEYHDLNYNYMLQFDIEG